MVTERTGVVKVVPPAKGVPPVGAAYQLIFPAEAKAPRVIDPVLQLEAGEVEVMLGIVFMVASTAVLAEVHPFPVAST